MFFLFVFIEVKCMQHAIYHLNIFSVTFSGIKYIPERFFIADINSVPMKH